MSIYRLVPVAPSTDPGWQRASNQGDVIVRASSPGEARAFAALAEAAHLQGGAPNMTIQVEASAFKDQTLYTVLLEAHPVYPEDGPDGVLEANFRKPPDFVPMRPD